jgi:hypothetical protein
MKNEQQIRDWLEKLYSCNIYEKQTYTWGIIVSVLKEVLDEKEV